MMFVRSRLLVDEQGASIIEMGLAAPLLAAMLIGMIDLSTAYSAKLHLEQAAQRTVEKLQVSAYSESDKATYKSEAEAAAGTGATAVVESWLECNGNGTKLPITSSCANAADPYARYVTIEISKTYTPIFKWTWGGANADGKVPLKGKAGIRVQ